MTHQNPVEPDLNRKELRIELTDRLAVSLIGFGALLILITWPISTIPIIITVPVSLSFLLLGGTTRLALTNQPALARRLIVWGLTFGLLVGMWLLTQTWLPFLGLLLIFVSALLTTTGPFVSALLIAALSIWLTVNGFRDYPLIPLIFTLIFGVGLSWQTVRTLYTALGWAWSSQQRAEKLLIVARDRQYELSQAYNSLNATNAIMKRTQNELIIARQQAEQERSMKGQFVANISHELRTPLNIILGFSEMMHLTPDVYGQMDWPLTLRKDMYQIYRNSRHLLEMIDDVLDLSQFEMTGFTLNKEPTPLEPLLRETLAIAEDLFRGHPVELHAHIASDLPTLTINRTRIRQVMLNLLNNALRFTEVGMVQLSASPQDDEIVISISDTGSGIPEDKLPHIFDEFYQVDQSLRRNRGGAGLGLTICQQFVQAHNGRIWVESSEGQGSTFTFTLPLIAEQPSVMPIRSVETAVSTWDELRPSILVVDPDPTITKLLQRQFGTHDVIQVERVRDLPDRIQQYHPHMVIANVPLAARLDENELHALPVPIIECALPSQTWAASYFSVKACLTKPVPAAQLLRELDKLPHVQNILIVDDDRGFCLLIERTLSTASRSFTVRRAYDGREGLYVMQQQPPDLILLDVVMQNMGGMELLEAMQQDAALAEIPVILLTATNYAEDTLTQRSKQFVVHHPTSFTPMQVIASLHAMEEILQPSYVEA